jgi:SAM-dependent methyltransferase
MYPANFTDAAFNPAVFSARRMPDRIHARIVKCNTCGLVRSDPIAAAAALADLYRKSTFEYAEEVENLRSTYGRYLRKLEAFGARKGSLLEIGCGNGFFFGEALAQGYAVVRGVEPSAEAVAKAPPSVRDFISCGIMHSSLFAPEVFDVVCLFQVFDHLPDPGAMLDASLHVLKPGGLLLLLNHNIDAVSARLLRERSPIIDLEHTYLYSPETLARMVGARGFRVRESGRVWNAYTLHYLVRLVPLPRGLKQALLTALRATGIGKLRLAVPLGNFYMVAQKSV